MIFLYIKGARYDLDKFLLLETVLYLNVLFLFKFGALVVCGMLSRKQQGILKLQHSSRSYLCPVTAAIADQCQPFYCYFMEFVEELQPETVAERNRNCNTGPGQSNVDD